IADRLSADSPVPGYLGRMLISGGPVGVELFRRLHQVSREGLAAMADAGIAAVGAGPEARAAVLLVSGLAPLMLRGRGRDEPGGAGRHGGRRDRGGRRGSGGAGSGAAGQRPGAADPAGPRSRRARCRSAVRRRDAPLGRGGPVDLPRRPVRLTAVVDEGGEMSDSTMIKNGGTAMGRRGAGVLRNRTLMRLPITLYRAGLGFLFGPRMLMLEHVGRKSGARRFVALEVVARPRPGSYVVPSGFGERSQWFRNVIAEPRVRVSTGFLRSRPATARRLTTAEADEVLAEYI